MAEPSPQPDSNEDTRVRPEDRPTTGTPRWMWVFGIIFIVLVLLVVIMMLVGGGHTPPIQH